jgi:ubiquitin carboxyl-terminal hydrolase 4/11/15
VRTIVEQEFTEHESLQKTEADEEMCVTLDDCLRMFTDDELLEGGSPWYLLRIRFLFLVRARLTLHVYDRYCASCKSHRAAQKRIDIWKCPPVLIVHLKRFQYTHVFRCDPRMSVPAKRFLGSPMMVVAGHVRHRDKVSTRVDFPVSGLDLSPYVNQYDPSTPPIYDLYAVSVRSLPSSRTSGVRRVLLRVC